MTLGYLRFGLLLGAAIRRSAEPWAAWSGAELMYGGSAHLTLIEMLRTGSGWWAAVGAALLINARLLVYSSALIPLWDSTRRPPRLLAAAVVIDPTWMLASRRAEQGTPAQQRAHFSCAAIVLTAGWTVAVTVGAVLGSVTAVTGVFAIAVPLCLVAIVVPHLKVPGAVRRGRRGRRGDGGDGVVAGRVGHAAGDGGRAWRVRLRGGRVDQRGHLDRGAGGGSWQLCLSGSAPAAGSRLRLRPGAAGR